MRIPLHPVKKARIEILPLIDIVFLLLVFFIYAMLSMAVHRGLPVRLPESSTAEADKTLTLAVTIEADGSIYLDKEPVRLEGLSRRLRQKADGSKEAGVLIFADKTLPYQSLFRVLDQVRSSGLTRISLQAEVEKSP